MEKASIPQILDYAWSISLHLRSPARWVFMSQKDKLSSITLLMSASSNCILFFREWNSFFGSSI